MKRYKYKVHSRKNDIFIIGQYNELGTCEAVFEGEANWGKSLFRLTPKDKYRKWVDGYVYKTVYMEDVKPMEEQ